jgi:hypothetical protein
VQFLLDRFLLDHDSLCNLVDISKIIMILIFYLFKFLHKNICLLIVLKGIRVYSSCFVGVRVVAIDLVMFINVSTSVGRFSLFRENL